MNGKTQEVSTLLLATVFGLTAAAPAWTAEEPTEALVALERLLHGDWDGLGPCDGEITFRADGTYEERYAGPGGYNSTGTWNVTWDALPPTLVLACKTSDAPGSAGKTFSLKLIKLDKEGLVIGYGEKARTRYERPKAIDEARAIEIAKALIAGRETWADRAEYVAKPQTGHWSIQVWRTPKTPGGHRLITLTREGKLKDYVRGR